MAAARTGWPHCGKSRRATLRRSGNTAQRFVCLTGTGLLQGRRARSRRFRPSRRTLPSKLGESSPWHNERTRGAGASRLLASGRRNGAGEMAKRSQTEIRNAFNARSQYGGQGPRTNERAGKMQNKAKRKSSVISKARDADAYDRIAPVPWRDEPLISQKKEPRQPGGGWGVLPGRSPQCLGEGGVRGTRRRQSQR
jgi:hypothetical protein